MGDMNVETLPVSSFDPYVHLPDRTAKHAEERMHFDELLTACGLYLHDIDIITGYPPPFPTMEFY